MKMKLKLSLIGLFLLIAALLFGALQNGESDKNEKVEITFIELGSVRCVPCRKMEQVLDSVRKHYPKRVKVIFYDVWTAAGRPYGKKYGVNEIPTQIFLDSKGEEYYRHTGYFPFEEVEKVINKKL